MSNFKFNNWDRSLIALGATRERRRVRGAHNDALMRFHVVADVDVLLCALDAATRTVPRKRK